MRSNVSLVAIALATLTSLAAPAARAHGGLFRGPGGPLPTPPPPPGNANSPNGASAAATARDVSPVAGSAPTLVFSEERWEFWWEFNHDAFVNLRPSLRNAPTSGNKTFEPVDAKASSELLAALVERMRDPDDQVRSAAVYSLARLDDASTFAYLSNAAVSDVSLAVRTNAVLALGLARNPKAVDRLKAFLVEEGSQDEVRAVAAIALGVSGLPDASAVLRDHLAGGAESHMPNTVRNAAIYALGLTQDPGNAPFLRTLAQSKSLDEPGRALAIEALGHVGDRAANSLIVEALASPQAQVRRSAAIALGVVAKPDDVDVVKALDRAAESDADGVVRSFSEISLGRIASQGAPAIVERLRARERTATMRQRPFVVLAIGVSGYDAAVPELLAQFKEEANTSMRGALAIALSMLGQKEAVPELRAAFKREKEPMLRGHLAYALGRLGDVESAKELREVLAKENDPQLLYWSAVGLALLGDRMAPSYLEELYPKTREQLTKLSYLHALGAIGDKTTAEFLTKIAKSPTETELARAFATSSLGLLTDEDRVPRTANFTRDHNYTLTSLAFVQELYYLF